jgi:tetratricopeptide (TPR) repeat protein
MRGPLGLGGANGLSLRTRFRLRQMGDRCRDERRWQEARSCYEQYLKVAPQDVAIWVQYGHACKELGDLEAAEAAYRKATEIAPADADARLWLGQSIKESMRAAKWLNRARAADPSDSPALARRPAADPNLFPVVRLWEIANEEFARRLYRGLLLREPDEPSLNATLQNLTGGTSRESMLRSGLACDEFRWGNHDEDSEARRLASLIVSSEFQQEVSQIFRDFLPGADKMSRIWDAIIPALFKDDVAFLDICRILGHPDLNNGWMGKLEGTELSGIIPLYSINSTEKITLTLNGRMKYHIPLAGIVRGTIDNGNGGDLLRVKVDLLRYCKAGGMLECVSVSVGDGVLIEPSPLYVCTPEMWELDLAMDEAESGSYDFFHSAPFLHPFSAFQG